MFSRKQFSHHEHASRSSWSFLWKLLLKQDTRNINKWIKWPRFLSEVNKRIRCAGSDVSEKESRWSLLRRANTAQLTFLIVRSIESVLNSKLENNQHTSFATTANSTISNYKTAADALEKQDEPMVLTLWPPHRFQSRK